MIFPLLLISRIVGRVWHLAVHDLSHPGSVVILACPAVTIWSFLRGLLTSASSGSPFSTDPTKFSPMLFCTLPKYCTSVSFPFNSIKAPLVSPPDFSACIRIYCFPTSKAEDIRNPSPIHIPSPLHPLNQIVSPPTLPVVHFHHDISQNP